MELGTLEARQLQDRLAIKDEDLSLDQEELRSKLYETADKNIEQGSLKALTTRIEDLETRTLVLQEPLVRLGPSSDLEDVKAMVNSIITILNNSRL